MKREEATFEGVGGLELFRRVWRPEGSPRARMLLAHGYGEHGERYAPFVERFVGEGFEIHALDHRGHGRSEGDRGHVDVFGDYVEDLHRLRGLAEDGGPELPLVVVGHSMGGLIAAQYLLAHAEGVVAGVLSSPALALRVVPPLVLRLAAGLLARFVPRASFASDLDAARLSHDPEVGPAYLGDPLVHQKATARFFVELQGAIEDAQARAAELTLPLLVLQAGEDAMVDPEGSERFAAGVSSAHKRFVRYPGLFHEIFLETDRDRVFEDLAGWFGEVLPTAAARRAR